MSKLSTKNTPDAPIGGSSGFVKSILEPGNYKVKINSIALRPERNAEYGDRIIMRLETEPIGGSFKGIAVDKNDAAKGTYEGRVGDVSLSRWSFRDFTTKNNKFIERVPEIMKALKQICHRLGMMEWWDSKDNMFDTVEDLVKCMDQEQPFKNKWFHVCLGGREWISADKKYLNHELWIVEDDRNLCPGFTLNENSVRKFFETEMVQKSDERPISSAPTQDPNQTKMDTSKTDTKQEDLFAGQTTNTAKVASSDNQNGPTKIVARTPEEEAFLSAGTNKSPFAEEKVSEDAPKDIVTGNDKDKLPWEI
jgi:hypothetical protein